MLGVVYINQLACFFLFGAYHRALGHGVALKIATCYYGDQVSTGSPASLLIEGRATGRVSVRKCPSNKVEEGCQKDIPRALQVAQLGAVFPPAIG